MKCIKETVSEAFQKGYLPDYFLDHKDEVQKMLDSEFDIQHLYNKFVNSIAAETEEKITARERKKADEHYLTAIINNKVMTIDAYCSCFNISENEIKELGYDALQKGLITKDSASTFFELPIDEVESQLKSFKNLH